MKLKLLILNIAILFACAPAISAADIKGLFLAFPSGIVKSIDRSSSITETSADGSLLKLKFPKDFSGEFKILSETKSELIVGFSVFSCDESDLEIWSLKKGSWKNITASACRNSARKMSWLCSRQRRRRSKI